jgi:hypothetical protein
VREAAPGITTWFEELPLWTPEVVALGIVQLAKKVKICY